MNNVWMSVLIRAPEQKPIRGILCDRDNEPLLWADQKNAFDFWMNFKSIFQIDFTKNIRATPQVVRDGYVDDVLFTKIDNQELIPILPIEGVLLYSDSWEHPCEIMEPENLNKLWKQVFNK